MRLESGAVGSCPRVRERIWVIGHRLGASQSDSEVMRVEARQGTQNLEQFPTRPESGGGRAQYRGLPEDTPVVSELPRMGTLDHRLISGEVRLRGVRIKAVTAANRIAIQTCRHFQKSGDTEVEADVRLTIKGGVITIVGVSKLGVRRGAPLDDRAALCISQVFAKPIDIAGPNRTGFRNGMTGPPGGRWHPLEGTEGTVVARVKLSSRPECAMESSGVPGGSPHSVSAPE
jgi:hypothetical protein